MITRLSKLRVWVLLLTTAGCGSSATKNDHPPQERQFQRAMAAPPRSDAPEYIPEAARSLLRKRMALHARHMSDLMNAVAILRYDDAAALAEFIIDDASLARPITGDAAELNTLLPERYFELQDGIRREARIARAAAQRMDALAVGRSYGRLAESCVSCHAMFRPSPDSKTGAAGRPGIFVGRPLATE